MNNMVHLKQEFIQAYSSIKISLKDIVEVFASDKNAYTAHSLYNKYKDEKIDSFIEKKYIKLRGHDL